MGHLSFVKLLLTYDADPNLQSLHTSFPDEALDPKLPLAEGRTALHFAAENHDKTIIRWLVKHQADPNRIDDLGRTPLMLAIGRETSSPSHAQVIRLLAQEANLEAKDKKGRTAYQLALESEDQTALSILRELSQTHP
jgi:ankyrin repeat protein